MNTFKARDVTKLWPTKHQIKYELQNLKCEIKKIQLDIAEQRAARESEEKALEERRAKVFANIPKIDANIKAFNKSLDEKQAAQLQQVMDRQKMLLEVFFKFYTSQKI